MNDKSLGQICAEGFGYEKWSELPASMRADFQRAGEKVAAEVQKRIKEQQRKERQALLDSW